MTTAEAIEWFDEARISFKHSPLCAAKFVGMVQLGNYSDRPNQYKLECFECGACSEILPGVLDNYWEHWDVWREVYDRMHGVFSVSC